MIDLVSSPVLHKNVRLAPLEDEASRVIDSPALIVVTLSLVVIIASTSTITFMLTSADIV